MRRQGSSGDVYLCEQVLGYFHTQSYVVVHTSRGLPNAGGSLSYLHLTSTLFFTVESQLSVLACVASINFVDLQYVLEITSFLHGTAPLPPLNLA